MELLSHTVVWIVLQVPSVEQDAFMSPNPRGKLEDLAAGCVCCLVI